MFYKQFSKLECLLIMLAIVRNEGTCFYFPLHLTSLQLIYSKIKKIKSILILDQYLKAWQLYDCSNSNLSCLRNTPLLFYYRVTFLRLLLIEHPRPLRCLNITLNDLLLKLNTFI